jgi:chromosome segregation ATPase
MEINPNELRDWSDGARRALEREREEMMSRVQLIDGVARTMEVFDEILAENERLKAEIDDLNEQLEQREQEIDDLCSQHRVEIDDLRRQMLEARNQHLETERQHLEAEVHAKPMEIHNHFEPGSSSQVFNDKVNGKFTKNKNDKKKNKKGWKKIVRKML